MRNRTLTQLILQLTDMASVATETRRTHAYREDDPQHLDESSASDPEEVAERDLDSSIVSGTSSGPAKRIKSATKTGTEKRAGVKKRVKRSNMYLHKHAFLPDVPALNKPRRELRFAKNSRKSRGAFGRGLPKKGRRTLT